MSREAWGDENPDDAFYDGWADVATDEGWFNPDDYSPGAIAILKERERQETEEAWTSGHDDGYTECELLKAAICYTRIAALKTDILYDEVQASRRFWRTTSLNKEWPWSEEWWKPKSRRQDLVRAGALIAAEIDRLDRAEARRAKKEQS